MKQAAIFLALIGTGWVTCPAQRPLRGSGNIITTMYNFSNFDKVTLQDMDGTAVIEAGAAYSVSIAIDDNLAGLLEVVQSGEVLTVALKGNHNNRMYIEHTGIKVKITMPVITQIHQDGNNSVWVTGIAGTSFTIRQSGNGNSTVQGYADKLQVRCSGNGTVNAAGLATPTAEVKTTGNGNTVVNVSDNLTATVHGNGSIVNKGAARFDANSSSSGNGRLISRPQ